MLRQASSFLQTATSLLVPEAPAEPGFEAVCSGILDDLQGARRQVEAASATRNEHVGGPVFVVPFNSKFNAGTFGSAANPAGGGPIGGRYPSKAIRADRDHVRKYFTPSSNPAGARNKILLHEWLILLVLRQGILKHGSDPPREQEPVVEALDPVIQAQPAPSQVLDALYSIKTTSFVNSFASRLYGGHPPPPKIFFQDWETMSPWMELTADIMDHYRISQSVPLCVVCGLF